MLQYKLITGKNDSLKDFGEAGAVTFIKLLQEFSRKPLCSWPTGTTPLPINDALRDMRNLVPAFIYANLDQYAGIQANDPRSYPHEVERELLGPLGLKLHKNLHFNSIAADPQAECARFNAALQAMGGFDIAAMGIGPAPDIHLAFNKAGTPFDALAHYTEIPEEIQQVNEKVTAEHGGTPTHAYTVGNKQLIDAKIALLFSNKPEETVDALHGPITTDVPASALQLRKGPTYVVATHDVAKALRLAA